MEPRLTSSEVYNLIEEERLFEPLATPSVPRDRGFDVCRWGRDHISVEDPFHTGLKTRIPCSATLAEAREKIVNLVERIQFKKAEEAERFKREREAQARFKKEEKARERLWIRTVRIAFGGNPDEKLPEHLKPQTRLLSNEFLLAARTRHDIGIGFHRGLREDLSKKAAFLRDLDALLTKHGFPLKEEEAS